MDIQCFKGFPMDSIEVNFIICKAIQRQTRCLHCFSGLFSPWHGPCTMTEGPAFPLVRSLLKG